METLRLENFRLHTHVQAVFQFSWLLPHDGYNQRIGLIVGCSDWHSFLLETAGVRHTATPSFLSNSCPENRTGGRRSIDSWQMSPRVTRGQRDDHVVQAGTLIEFADTVSIHCRQLKRCIRISSTSTNFMLGTEAHGKCGTEFAQSARPASATTTN